MNRNTKKIPKRFVFSIIALSLAAVILTATLLGPQIILAAVKQPSPENDFKYSEYFLNTYEDVRKNLDVRCKKLQKSGYTVEKTSYAVDEKEALYIDNIYLPAKSEERNLIVLTTGVHGIEGYIGSVMLDVFFEEIFEELDHETTGILIVANVNPYGMKHMRRYNENNVDLNRNFIENWEEFDLSSNKEYPKVEGFLQPEGKIGNALWHEAGFYLSLAKEAVTVGADTVSDALLTGQYEYPEGVYYGGNGDEKSTAYLKGVFADCLEGSYKNIIHIDLHSGYGPRYDMVIFNSVFDTMSEKETAEAFGYDHIIAYDSESFYATTGDTTDYFYRLHKSTESDKELFSTCFEFGTIGDSFFDTILSLKYTVDENRQHRFPTDSKTTEKIIAENYKELFYPTETEWREATVEDFIAATKGVLKAKLK